MRNGTAAPDGASSPAATSGRFGKFPNGIATMEGLSFEATAIAARRFIHVGAWGTGYESTAGAFKPARPNAKCGMHHETFRHAVAELGKHGVWERCQRGRGHAKERLLIEPGARQYRRIEAAWVEGRTFTYRELATVAYVRAVRGGATTGQVAQRFGCTHDTARKLCKALTASGWFRDVGTIATPRYAWAKEPVRYEETGHQRYEETGNRSYEETGRKLTVSLPLIVSDTQGAEHDADEKPGTSGLEGAPCADGAPRQPIAPAEGASGSPRVKVSEGSGPTVSRELVDKAHLHDLMPDVFNRLAKRLGSKTLPPVEDVDKFFAGMIDRAIKARVARCKVEGIPDGLPVLLRRPKAQVIAEHGDRVYAARLSALEEKDRAERASMAARVQARFTQKPATHRQLLAASLRGTATRWP